MQELRQTFRSLKHRNFRLYYFGQIVSLCGTWMQNVALAWLVYRLTKSSVWLGLMECATHIPMVLFGLSAGWIADHFDRRRTIIITQSLAMVQALVLAYLTLTERIQIWHAVCLAFFLGSCTAFELPSRQAFLVDLVQKDDLVNAVSLNSSMFNLARFLGPALAGYVVLFAGEGLCFAINAVSYGAVLLALFQISVSCPSEVGEEKSSRSVKQGFQFVWQSRLIRPVVLLVFFVTLFAIQYSVLLPVIAAEVLHGGPATLGNLRASAGLGALCAALTLANRGSGPTLLRGVGYASCGLGFSLFCLSLSSNMALSCLILLFVGFCNVTLLSGGHSLVQLSVTDALRGRVMSIYMILMLGVNPVGSLAVGCAAKRFGAPHTVMVCSFIGFLVGLIYLGSTRKNLIKQD